MSRVNRLVIVNSAEFAFAREPLKNFLAVDNTFTAAAHVHENIFLDVRGKKFVTFAHAESAKTFVTAPSFFVGKQILNFVAVDRARLAALQTQRQDKGTFARNFGIGGQKFQSAKKNFAKIFVVRFVVEFLFFNET